MANTKRLNIDYPFEEYGYLKLMAHRLNMTLKDFCTQKLIAAVEEEEDNLLAVQVEQRLATASPDDFIPWEQAIKEAGWDV